MALADDIKAKLDAIKAKAPLQPDRQAQAAAVLQTKASGKATPPLAPVSNEAQAGAVAEGQAALAQQAGAEQLQTANLATQKTGLLQRLASAKADLESKGRQTTAALQSNAAKTGAARQATGEEFSAKLAASQEAKLSELSFGFNKLTNQLAADRGVAEQDIFSSFRRENKELDFRKDAAELEQLAFSLALKDKAYMQAISEAAAVQNLQDANRFREESTRLILGEALESALRDTKFAESFAHDERTFQKEMSQISFDEALKMANASIKQANTQAVIGGLTSAAAGAASAKYGGSEAAAPGASTMSDNTSSSELMSAGTMMA